MNAPLATELFDTKALADLLADCQLNLIDDPHGPQAVPADAEQSGPADSFISAMADLSVISVSGDDRLSFLQGQLTNNIEGIEVGAVQWTGLCSPKGRLLASFLAIRQPDSVLLITSRELAASMAKRLSMYVLRAKVKVVDLSATTLVIGLYGDKTGAALSAAGIAPPGFMQATSAAGIVGAIGLSDPATTDKTRALLVLGIEAIQPVWTQLIEHLPARASSWWRATEIAAGTARITPAIQETFVPQMINFELIGGVDFDKGCYTGQEVVARSQHLGKMKRRMFLGGLDVSDPSLVVPGTSVLSADGKQTGVVVSSAPGVAVGMPHALVVLFEAQVDRTDSVTVLGGALTPLALPYDIPEPAPFVRPQL